MYGRCAREQRTFLLCCAATSSSSSNSTMNAFHRLRVDFALASRAQRMPTASPFECCQPYMPQTKAINTCYLWFKWYKWGYIYRIVSYLRLCLCDACSVCFVFRWNIARTQIPCNYHDSYTHYLLCRGIALTRLSRACST